MGWVIVVLVAAIIVGLTGVLLLDPPLAGPDSEKVFIVMSGKFLHPVLAGICISGILAAIMSTASAQLLVASSAFAEDFYKGIFRRNPGRAELLWVGRGTVLTIAALAYVLALNPGSKVLDLVAWAWAGFGAAFGPAIVLSLYWDRMTRNGALAGIVSGSGPTCAFLCASADAAVQVGAELAGAGVCRTVRVASGPVHGARVVPSASE
jgi:sodium/proline symporter